MPKRPIANFADWDKVKSLSLAIASHLWVGHEPEPENKVTEPSEAYRKFRYLKSVYKERNGSWPKGFTLVNRGFLREAAEECDERPPFLYPEERQPPSQRKKGAPKPETMAFRKKAYDEIERFRNLLGDKATIIKASESAALDMGRTASAIRRARNHHIEYMKGQNGKNNQK